MGCFHPVTCYRAKHKNPSGKYGIVFKKEDGQLGSELQVPCGQCIGCRLEKSRQWALRCVFESYLYTNNCFVTLTYDDDHCPTDDSLNKRHIVLFLKRLRKAYSGIDPVTKTKNGVEVTEYPIRFYMCGEYGENFGRPHYHLCLFNIDFEDKVLYKNVNGFRLHTSKSLEKLWGKGFVTLSDVTFETAAYTARYVTKKITGKNAEEHYQKVDPLTGEIHNIEPEYNNMSRNPGIAKGWYDQYKQDLKKDYVTFNGVKHRIPKYFDRLTERTDLEFYEITKKRRVEKAKENQHNNTQQKLDIREKIKLKQFDQLNKRRSL